MEGKPPIGEGVGSDMVGVHRPPSALKPLQFGEGSCLWVGAGGYVTTCVKMGMISFPSRVNLSSGTIIVPLGSPMCISYAICLSVFRLISGKFSTHFPPPPPGYLSFLHPILDVLTQMVNGPVYACEGEEARQGLFGRIPDSSWEAGESELLEQGWSKSQSFGALPQLNMM